MIRGERALATLLAITTLVCIVMPSPASHAQSTERPVRLGFVGPLSTTTIRFEPFWARLRELGWVEGQNLVVESRSAEGKLERLPALMTEVIDRKVDLLVTYGTPGALAAKKATTTLPIVAWAIHDPVRSGVVTNLARPGANLTGLSTGFTEGFAGKLLELLDDAVPRLSTVAVIVNRNNPMPRDLLRDIEKVAPARDLKLFAIDLNGADAIEVAFDRARQKAQAVVVMGEPMTLERLNDVVALAAKNRLPAVYLQGDYVEAGGLMSYGPDFAAMWRRGGDYVDKILKGAKPADLPIEQPTRYVLTVNLRTAKGLGLTIPESILVRADNVIR